MDWIHENRLKTILIIGLLAVNLMMVFLMWWKMPHAPAPPVAEDAKHVSGSAGLMKQVLDLSDAQTQRIDTVLRARREEGRQAADSLAALKLRLAEELFIDPPDTARANALAREIGRTQATVEMNRYRNFRDIVSILSSDQKRAFKPVVVELFGRKPPREETLPASRHAAGRRDEPEANRTDSTRPEGRRPQDARDKSIDTAPLPPRDGEPPSPGDGKAGPPTVEEKLARYVQRLSLTDAQARSVEKILRASRDKGKALRAMRDPDPAAVDAGKEQIRKEEDEQIMQILTDQQKQEFTVMRTRKPR